MGQYFIPVLERNDKTTVFDNHFKVKGNTEKQLNFMKLTEHSWVNDEYTEGFCNKLLNKPARVMWAGDYSDNTPRVSADGTSTKINQYVYYMLHNSKKDIYRKVKRNNPWYRTYAEYKKAVNDRKERITAYEDAREKINFERKPYVNYNGKFNSIDKFIYNISRNEYIDMSTYIKRSMESIDDKGYVDCLHPLPILTSTSNGQCGGDYCGINEDYAGRWCYDEIVVYNDKKKIPDTATELVVTFNERMSKDEYVEGVA